MTKFSERRVLAAPAVGGIAVLFFLLNAAMPNSASNGQLLFGAYRGLMMTLVAAGLILIYRSVRIINFLQIILGGAGATLVYELTTRSLLPYPIALPLGLLSGIALGAIVGLLFVLFFFDRPRLVLTVATIIMLGLLAGLQFFVASRFRKPGEIDERGDFFPWPGVKFSVNGITFGIAHIVGAALAIAAIVGLWLFFKRSRYGIAIRGSAENAERASLLGVNTKALQIAVWMIAGLFGAMFTTLSMPSNGYSQGIGTSPQELLMPLTAAVIARMRSLPVAMLSAFGLSMMNDVVLETWVPAKDWVDIILFGTILVALLLQRRKVGVRQTESSTWQGIKEVRPTPPELMAISQIRLIRRGAYALLGLLALGYPWIASVKQLGQVQGALIWAVIGVSLVILTGWAGQMSLGHFAFVVAGAWFASMLGAAGWPFVFVLLITGLVGGVLAMLAGIPALRIKGQNLAVTTLAMGIIAPIVFFGESFLGRHVLDDERLGRPKFLLLNFEDAKSMYYLLALILFAVFLMARSLRKSRTGRVLIALREDEAGAQSFGIDTVRALLSSFALSGFLAAFAGALLAYQLRGGLTIQSFTTMDSINVFIMVVVGGLGSLAGGILGPFLYIMVPGLIPNPVLSGLIFSSVPIVIVFFIPGGLVQMTFGVRDAILRIFATRHHVIVPSLFADYSREAWEHRLVPLAPPMPNRGLGALRPDQRYRLPSRLWGAAREQVKS